LTWINRLRVPAGNILAAMRLRLVPVLLCLAVSAAGSPSLAAPVRNPRLATLQIEIWPEYDRPQNLVILKGELAPDARLPAAIALRIPAAARAPSAVAYIDDDGKLLNLGHDREDAGQFVLVRLTTPKRAFHVEFYEPLLASEGQREYRYAWPGDLAVERLGVLVKEPAGATNLSISPELSGSGASLDGLTYRAGDFGALKAGEQWVVAVRYTKSDPRSTNEILAASPPRSAAKAADAPSSWYGWAGLAAAGLALAGAVLVALWSRSRPAAASTCTKCGHASTRGDRFCAGCGAPLPAKR